MENSELAKIVRRCQDLPGHELFEYIDEAGVVRDIKSGDVNEYLRSIAGREFSAKDFRTWAGTVAAAYELGSCEACTSQAAAKRVVNAAVAKVAERLGNTKAVCRKAYIHPVVITAYLEATLQKALQPKSKTKSSRRNSEVRLPAHELAVLRLLESHQRQLGKTKIVMKVATA